MTFAEWLSVHPHSLLLDANRGRLYTPLWLLQNEQLHHLNTNVKDRTAVKHEVLLQVGNTLYAVLNTFGVEPESILYINASTRGRTLIMEG